jgi:hypothetical protein
MCSCQRTVPILLRRDNLPRAIRTGKITRQVVGVTGVEPVTLRLSSACSNQLSYTPAAGVARNLKSQIEFEIPIGGAEEIRTPDL